MRKHAIRALLVVAAAAAFADSPVQRPPGPAARRPESQIAPALLSPVVGLTPAGASLRLAIVGDAGDGTADVAVGIARLRASARFDAIILPGDNIYPCGVRSTDDPQWHALAALAALDIPMYPVLGNHDYGSPRANGVPSVRCSGASPDAQIFASETFPNWRFPARNYRIHTPVADLAMLDTEPLALGHTTLESVAPNEVAPTLAAMLRASSGWKIAVGHHPVISSGYHGYFPRDEHARMQAIAPVLRAEKADLYICGHDHHLELLAPRGGVRYLVSGASSDPIPAIALHASTVWPQNIRHDHGFAVVEVTAKQLSIRFYDVNGVALSPWIRYNK
jgi:predicted phosphodiesterase